MREGWTYKKLGEICEIERGGSPRPIQQYITDEEDGLNWIKIGDAVEGSKYINSTKEKIIKEGLKKTRFVHKGDFILSNSMSFGKPYILGIDGCIHDGWLVIRDTYNHFDKSFLYYLLGSPNMYNEFKRLAVGGVVNNLNSQLVRSVSVPIPPLSEQERIVSELDLLSSIIEKKKEQLKEYDQLAQSIFYDMFGDPVTNENGWEVKTMEEVGRIVTGNTPSTKDNRNYDSKDVCFIKPSDIEKDGISLLSESEFYISTFAYNNARKLPKGSVLVTCIGIVGKVGILEIEATCNQQINAIIPNNQVDSNYVAFSILAKRRIIESIAHAPVVPIINKGTFSQLSIPLPPLSLQKSFAEKIEAIEKQKSLVQQSIVETQTMFDYTMDKYFG